MNPPQPLSSSGPRHRGQNLLLGGALSAVVVLVGYLMWSGYWEAIHGAETTSRNYAAIIEARLDATLRRADAYLQELVREVPVGALSKSAVPRYAAELDAMLDLRLFNFPELAGIRIFDANGELIYTSDSQTTPRVNVADRDFFVQARTHPQGGPEFEVNVVRTTERPSLIMARALRDGQGVFRGVGMAAVEIGYFQKLFDSQDIGPNGVIAIFRKDNFSLVTRWPLRSAAGPNRPLPRGNPAERTFATGMTRGTVELVAPFDGTMRIFSFHALTGYPFFVSVGLAKDDILVRWREQSATVGLSALLLLALLTGLFARLRRAEARQAQSLAILAQSEERTRLVLDTSMDAVIGLNGQGMITEWTAGAVAMFGHSRQYALGKRLSELVIPPALRESHIVGLKRIVGAGDGLGFGRRTETIAMRADGSQFPVEVSMSHIQRGDDHFFTGFVRDITLRKAAEAERLALESQVREMQKMEAIGKLTGGMAHDFNNYLAVIIGSLDLLRESVDDDPLAAKLADSALEGALRSAELVQSLLSFARRQPLNPRRIDVSRDLDTVVALLRRTLGEDVALTTEFAPGIWPIRIDSAQLDSCIVNLANNARDAMSGGGVLTLSVKNIRIGDAAAKPYPDLATGDYVLIEVSDTGTGMAPEIAAQAFEPFFSTKPAGHGTGLGLSMVYGFVKQSGGHVAIQSDIGQGTRVRMYLPRDVGAEEAIEAKPEGIAAAPPAVGGGKAVILVVEDNERLRTTASMQLASLGYQVIAVEDGIAALEVIDRQDQPLDLLFADIVLPGGINGYELSKFALKRRPGIKVVLTSGYAERELAGRDMAELVPHFLSKPYRLEELARAIRAGLEAAPSPNG